MSEMIDISRRTPAVVEAILYVLPGESNPKKISSKKLDKIDWLYLDEGCDVPILKKGDFDGLNNLEELDLSKSSIEELPEGVFDGLGKLKELNLEYNLIKDFPGGVFKDLSNLDNLNLEGNKLEKIDLDLFSNLSNLKTLYLGCNEIKELPNGVFSDQKILNYLDVSGHEIKDIEDYLVFKDLEKLKHFVDRSGSGGRGFDESKVIKFIKNSNEKEKKISSFGIGD